MGTRPSSIAKQGLFPQPRIRIGELPTVAMFAIPRRHRRRPTNQADQLEHARRALVCRKKISPSGGQASNAAWRRRCMSVASHRVLFKLCHRSFRRITSLVGDLDGMGESCARLSMRQTLRTIHQLVHSADEERIGPLCGLSTWASAWLPAQTNRVSCHVRDLRCGPILDRALPRLRESLRSLKEDNGKERWHRQEHPAKYPPVCNPHSSAADALGIGRGGLRVAHRRLQIVEKGLAKPRPLDRRPTLRLGPHKTAGALPTFHERRPSCTNGAMTIL